MSPLSEVYDFGVLCYYGLDHFNGLEILFNMGIQSRRARVADNLVAAKQLDAGKIIKQHIAPLIKGGGGGQKI